MPRITKQDLLDSERRASIRADMLSKVLHELALGNPAEHTETSPDYGPDAGGQITLTLYRSASAAGGVVMVIRRGVNSKPDVDVYGARELRDIARNTARHSHYESAGHACNSWLAEAMLRVYSRSEAIALCRHYDGKS